MSMKMEINIASLAIICGFLLCAGVDCSFGILNEAYPSSSSGLDSCGMKTTAEPFAQQRKKITDITHVMRPDLPSFGDTRPLGGVTRLMKSMGDGSDFNLSEMKMNVHSGTHLDAPGHFVNELYEAGYDVNGLDLDVLVGPVLIVDTPRDSNITAKALESLDIPLGVQRIIFRTANTDKRLMWIPNFDSSFIGITEDGAEWLVANRPDIKLVGTDYLSAAAFEHNKAAHRALLWKVYLYLGLPSSLTQYVAMRLFSLSDVVVLSEEGSGQKEQKIMIQVIQGECGKK